MKTIEELMKGGMTLEQIVAEAERVDEKMREQETYKEELEEARTEAAEALIYYFTAVLDGKMPTLGKQNSKEYKDQVDEVIKEWTKLEELTTSVMKTFNRDRNVTMTGEAKINKEALSKLLGM